MVPQLREGRQQKIAAIDSECAKTNQDLVGAATSNEDESTIKVQFTGLTQNL